MRPACTSRLRPTSLKLGQLQAVGPTAAHLVFARFVDEFLEEEASVFGPACHSFRPPSIAPGLKPRHLQNPSSVPLGPDQTLDKASDVAGPPARLRSSTRGMASAIVQHTRLAAKPQAKTVDTPGRPA